MRLPQRQQQEAPPWGHRLEKLLQAVWLRAVHQGLGLLAAALLWLLSLPLIVTMPALAGPRQRQCCPASAKLQQPSRCLPRRQRHACSGKQLMPRLAVVRCGAESAPGTPESHQRQQLAHQVQQLRRQTSGS